MRCLLILSWCDNFLSFVVVAVACWLLFATVDVVVVRCLSFLIVVVVCLFLVAFVAVRCMRCVVWRCGCGCCCLLCAVCHCGGWCR